MFIRIVNNESMRGVMAKSCVAYPHKISGKNISDVVKLPYLGQKIGAMVHDDFISLSIKLTQRALGQRVP